MNTRSLFFFIFFFNDTATTEIYTLSLHDALPIYDLARYRISKSFRFHSLHFRSVSTGQRVADVFRQTKRSEEHTSELQSQSNLVCRLLLEKKKKIKKKHSPTDRQTK